MPRTIDGVDALLQNSAILERDRCALEFPMELICQRKSSYEKKWTKIKMYHGHDVASCIHGIWQINTVRTLSAADELCMCNMNCNNNNVKILWYAARQKLFHRYYYRWIKNFFQRDLQCRTTSIRATQYHGLSKMQFNAHLVEIVVF